MTEARIKHAIARTHVPVLQKIYATLIHDAEAAMSRLRRRALRSGHNPGRGDGGPAVGVCNSRPHRGDSCATTSAGRLALPTCPSEMNMIQQTDHQQDRLNEAAHNAYVASIDNVQRAAFLSRPSVMLGLVPEPDGGKWSVLYGSNIQEGICGFGDTPDEAMADFDRAWKEDRTPEARRLSL